MSKEDRAAVALVVVVALIVLLNLTFFEWMRYGWNA